MTNPSGQSESSSAFRNVEKRVDQIWLLVAVVFIILAIWILVPFTLAWMFGLKTPETMGELGDMFGSVNALLAGLAFAGLIWSILQSQRAIAIQRDELKLQRDELKMQREELIESRILLADQASSQVKMTDAIMKLTARTRQGNEEASKTRSVAIISTLIDSKSAYLGRHGAALPDGTQLSIQKEIAELEDKLKNL